MLSFFKKVYSSVLGGVNEEEVDEEEVFKNINLVHKDRDNSSEDSSDDTDNATAVDASEIPFNIETFNCAERTGKITFLSDEYGLIDGIVYFERRHISPGLVVEINDEVCYKAYKAKENEAERVYKIYALRDDSWDKDDSPIAPPQTTVRTAEAIHTIARTLTGNVTKRNGREVYIESLNVRCNLDKIEASYVPVEGDWVSLDALVTIDVNSADFSGDVLEIKSLKPLLPKNGIGRITAWSSIKKFGVIEGSICFTNMACDSGYTPEFGDEVKYHAIESDQEGFSWRATKVIPNKVGRGEHEIEETPKLNPLFLDKNDVTITPFVCVIELKMHQTKEVTLEVTNNGSKRQLLKSFRFLSRGNQIRATSPKVSFFILPNQTRKIIFTCKGTLIGMNIENILFYFDGFVIVRRFEILVGGSKEMNELLHCGFSTIPSFNNKDFGRTIKTPKADICFYGPRIWKVPKFTSREAKCVYRIPKKLQALFEKNLNENNFIKELLKFAPYLKESLNVNNYADRFHMLLYLEEMMIRHRLMRYSIENAVFTRIDAAFVLTVPGLSEGRPSLVMGDRITVLQTAGTGKIIKYTGTVNSISEKTVFLEFHSVFEDNYDKFPCNVFFEPNVNFLERCHASVNRVLTTHEESWLFPTTVKEKPAQIAFETPEEVQKINENLNSFFQHFSNDEKLGKNATAIPSTAKTISSVEEALRSNGLSEDKTVKKKLVWANKNLNERQKLAVVNVLRGHSKPLPYIIFGPPGTGKTVTLVEITIQLYRLLPESRILIATPSNSSADLICERLIDMEKMKPGQLVRLLALYRVTEGLVPQKLIPYCTFFAPQNSRLRNSNLVDPNYIRPSSLNELAGKHRITISTCATNGIFHYHGVSRGHFTHILVDEAGQTSEPEVLMSATFQNVQSGQVVLTGDPQQLGPVVCCKVAKRFGLGVSLLERLVSRFPYARDPDGFPETSGFDPRFITQLVINYRSVPEILSLPSQMFYNGELIPTVSQTESPEAAIIEKVNIAVEDRAKPPALIFHGVIGQNYQDSDSPSWYNPHEIWQALFYLTHFYSVGLNSSQIGIISPYAQQVKKIKSVLAEMGLAVPKVGSVEEFQGQERHVIILTTVRSSPNQVSVDVMHSLGFVASPNRLNVALTRARAVLVIIGNPTLLLHDPYWRVVIEYCKKNKSYLGCNLDINEEIEKASVEDSGNDFKPAVSDHSDDDDDMPE